MDIAVSTAQHDLRTRDVEACHAGAYPVVPDRLSYVELFPEEFRYSDDGTLIDTLETLCRAYVAGQSLRGDRRTLTQPYGADLIKTYEERIQQWCGVKPGFS